MLYKGKREAKPNNTAIIVAAIAALGIVVWLVVLFSNRDIPRQTDMTMAAAALPVIPASKTSEFSEKATTTASSLATVTEKVNAATATKVNKSTTENKVKTVGIVNASDVNLREKPVDGTVIATLTRGSAVVINSKEDSWCEVAYGGMTGYVSARLLNEKSKVDLDCTGKIVADALNVRAFPSSSSSIICQAGGGAYVDVTGFENGWFAVTTNYGSGYVRAEYMEIGVEKPEVSTPIAPVEIPSEISAEDESTNETTTTTTTAYSGTGANLAATAQQYLGYSYSYGGAGPSSFDCSGFTMYIYGLYGVSLPHGATSQYGYGTAVSQSELQPGDLVFFSYGGDAIGHVGIYVGDRNFIHASTYGVGVIISSLDGGSYPSRYVGARRIF